MNSPNIICNISCLTISIKGSSFEDPFSYTHNIAYGDWIYIEYAYNTLRSSSTNGQIS